MKKNLLLILIALAILPALAYASDASKWQTMPAVGKRAYLDGYITGILEGNAQGKDEVLIFICASDGGDGDCKLRELYGEIPESQYYFTIYGTVRIDALIVRIDSFYSDPQNANLKLQVATEVAAMFILGFDNYALCEVSEARLRATGKEGDATDMHDKCFYMDHPRRPWEKFYTEPSVVPEDEYAPDDEYIPDGAPEKYPREDPDDDPNNEPQGIPNNAPKVEV